MISYRLDSLTIGTIAVAALDAWTTYYFITHGLGVEKNAILASLAQHSLLWIPVHTLMRALLVPMMPDVCRQTFASSLLTAHSLLAGNNLSGISIGRFILVDTIGFAAVVGISASVGVITFIYQLATKHSSCASVAYSTALVMVWLIILSAVEGVFYLIGRSL
jgi:hypothetical protein